MNRTIITLLSLFAVLPTLLLAKQIEVCPSCKFSAIQLAIDEAEAGDIIMVKNGKYEGGLLINKRLEIWGEDNVVIDGSESQSHIIAINSDSVVLKKLIVSNVGKSHTKDFAAIYTHKVTDFLFEEITINNPFFAFLIEKSKRGIIRNCTINGVAEVEHNSGNGIHMWHCEAMLVEGNAVYQMRDGIYFEFVEDSKVERNHSERNIRYGLHFMFSNHDEYRDNVFRNNGAGVAVMFSKFIGMFNNQFVKNWGTASYGLLLKEIYDAEIEQNTFSQNTVGINADGSTRIYYKANNFINNGWAVKFIGACYNNEFKRNNFIGNAFDLSYTGMLNDNIFEENYWSEYSGYDLDKDGIGDIPYRPVKLFSYVVNQTPETIILLRSLFVDIINFSEKVSPVFTPDNLKDEKPLIKPVQ